MKLKRLLAGLIAVAMTASMLPAVVFADESENEPEQTTAATTTEAEKKETEKPSEKAEPEKKEEPKAEEPVEPAEPAEPAEEDKADEVKGKSAPETDAVPEEAANKWGKISWTYDEGTNTLTISGSGAMPTVSDWNEVPWKEYSSKAEKVIIKNGVTSICNQAFWDFIILQTLPFQRV